MTGGPLARRTRRPAVLRVALALYGVTTAMAGIAVAAASAGGGPAGAAGAAGSTAGAPSGRPMAAATLVPPVVQVPVPLRDLAGTAVPPARVARSAPVRTAFRPALLVLPGGATAPVVGVGLHPDGALVIPDDPATVGWWDGGAMAGDPFGGVVIAGHVDSARFGLGVMSRLRALVAGQVVELRSGTRRAGYRVGTRRRLPQAELAARSDAFRQDVGARLVLITCGGPFDPVRHRYRDNLVVVATPLATS